MVDLKAIIARIEQLVADHTPASVTYAALECRLAIEKICYERLIVAHSYIAREDLRGWRPGDVMTSLITQVDGRAASEQTLFISKQPSEAWRC
jgi:hypothetical protein